MDLQIGMTHEVEFKVSDSMTANAVGSGSIEVLATPMMIAMMEKAASELVDAHTDDGITSVGTEINIVHTSATPVGLCSKAIAEVLDVSGREISFKLEAFDSCGAIGHGSHKRAVVTQEKFKDKVYSKLDK